MIYLRRAHFSSMYFIPTYSVLFDMSVVLSPHETRLIVDSTVLPLYSRSDGRARKAARRTQSSLHATATASQTRTSEKKLAGQLEKTHGITFHVVVYRKMWIKR